MPGEAAARLIDGLAPLALIYATGILARDEYIQAACRVGFRPRLAHHALGML